MQCHVLAQMIALVDNNLIPIPLFDPIPDMTNSLFLRQHVSLLLQNAFHHLSQQQIQVFLDGLFTLNQDLTAFKLHVRDFLIQLREFSGSDNSDLFLEEREQELSIKKQNELNAARKIPGLLKPSELDDLD